MNSRNYDTNVPPLASNTVTIGTSANPQVRIVPQTRPVAAIPMRQPVPIRKIIHDGSGGGASTSNSSYTMVAQVKEEIDNQDYPGASTSSGPLIGPTSSNNFQQYQRGGPSGAGPSNSTVQSGALVMTNNGMNSMAMDQPAPVNLASKVAEVFLTAGHAFQKLGDLTLQLHTTTDADESKWSEKEVDNLKNALTRFAHELDQISTCVANRSTKHIKNDIKRRHMMPEEPPQHAKRMAMTAVGPAAPSGSGTYTTMNTGMLTGHAVPLGKNRVGGPPINKMMTRTVIPTTRYTVAPIQGSSTYIPNTTVVVNPSQSPSPAGMPQLQSQNMPSTSNAGQPPTRILATTTGQTVTRIVPQQMLQGGGVKSIGGTTIKRVMTPTTSGAMSIPTSGALILEQ
ncbi:hypothetical protein CAEBREN_07653 [Caenorhabditis brenneri]|uniref:Uncharacterized protein n=1 Tax=Caenorhabditis brenneri TaxID=135651 RepID=G0N0U3_CAEBE|nr:hypothetical protein CAEBREN_07653 [Caenorhabditis brenneri]